MTTDTTSPILTANQYAVIGRRPDDDEDSVIIVEAAGPEAAKIAFTEKLWADGDGVWESREDCKDSYGTDIFIVGVIAGRDLSIEDWS